MNQTGKDTILISYIGIFFTFLASTEVRWVGSTPFLNSFSYLPVSLILLCDACSLAGAFNGGEDLQRAV
ncbi:hypothetical protein KFK09_011927 [Dendrobium nobile]|uniref:Uncharacterized protein n=1 Tax=Dendrobium nobile TaxID=94219 RepID=A0A8T3BDZ6_DENNO|nr:hypothetical protein KFK09_011927 [Dendrobium nobile]